MAPRRRTALTQAGDLAVYAGARAAAALAGLAPPPLVEVAARTLAGAGRMLDARHRRTVRDNLRLALGQALDEGARDRLIRAHFRHLALSSLEVAGFHGRRGRRALDRAVVAGVEHLEAARAAGRGALIVSAHLGNWELIGLWLTHRGYPLVSVARRQDNPWLDAWLLGQRRRDGQEILYKKGALRGMLRALEQGSLVGLLIDQNERVDPLFVDFFGQPASVNRGAAAVALRTGAPVLMSFSRRVDPAGRQPEGRLHCHALDFEPPLYARRDLPREEALLDLTRRMTERIEVRVRETPAQWLWAHRRWKTQPKEQGEREDE